MTEEQAKVREYHQRFGCTVNDRPTWAGADEHRVRVALIEEELAELRNAGEARDLVEVADALADRTARSQHRERGAARRTSRRWACDRAEDHRLPPGARALPER